MATGLLATAFMCLAIGQNQSGAYYANQRNLGIPAEIQESRRPNIRQLLLYSSNDQGRTWQQAAAITPDKKEFLFYAPSDGLFWFRVAIVSTSGQQDPDDRSLKNGPPDMSLIIDTLQPIIKSFQAQRSGDEVVVSWEVQEDHPDMSAAGLRLEYQVKDSKAESWTPIPAQPGLQGRTSFRPATNQAIVIRVIARDLAKNQSHGMAEVAGTVATAGFTQPVVGGNNQQGAAPPLPPKEIKLPDPPSLGKTLVLPPPPPMGDMSPQKASFPNPPVGLVVPPPQPKENPPERIIADSRTPPPEAVKPPQRESQIAPPPGGLVPPPPSDGMFDIKPIAKAAPARKPLPALTYVRIHQVLLQYQLSRVGPSGIGGVELWMTKDDGETWERYAADEDTATAPMPGNQERKFDLRDRNTDVPLPDGIYGMSLVVKNRAGLGRKPRPGDVPEIRVEIDTQTPVAQMYPPIADPQHPDQLLLKWNANDKNLTATPINLEYAEHREGPWHPIKLDQENAGRYTNQHVTGDYSWKVPPNIPVQVYLRLRVRDKAGNEGVAVTADPQFVDLVEPEGRLIGVQPQTKNP